MREFKTRCLHLSRKMCMSSHVHVCLMLENTLVPRFLSCLTNGMPSHHLCALLADVGRLPLFTSLFTSQISFRHFHNKSLAFLNIQLLSLWHAYTVSFLKVVPAFSSKKKKKKKKKTYLYGAVEMPQLRPRVVKTCRYRRYIIDSGGGEVRAPSRFFGPSAVFRTSRNHRIVTYTTDNDRVFDPPVMKMSYAYCPVLEDGGVRWRGFRFGSATEQVSNAGWGGGVTV